MQDLKTPRNLDPHETAMCTAHCSASGECRRHPDSGCPVAFSNQRWINPDPQTCQAYWPKEKRS